MLRTLLFSTLSISLVVFAGGCATSQPAASETAASPATAAPAQSFAEQVTLGGTLYGQHCASCHGASGQGDKAPRVVGLKEGALPLDPPADRKFRKNRFVTVADVAQFVVATMPPPKPGEPKVLLSEDEYWAILAFDLKANGIDLPAPLTPAMAQTLTIPR